MKPDFFRRGLCALLSVFVLLAPAAGRAALQEADFRQWGLLAVQDEGRRKPLDSFAHDALLRITGGSFMGIDVYRDTAGRVWHPNDFLLSILSADAPRLEERADDPRQLSSARPTPRAGRGEAAFFLRGAFRPARFHRHGPEEPRPALRRTGRATHARAAGGRERRRPARTFRPPAQPRRSPSSPPPGGDGRANGTRRGSAVRKPADATGAAYGEAKLAPIAQRFNDTLDAYRDGQRLPVRLGRRGNCAAICALSTRPSTRTNPPCPRNTRTTTWTPSRGPSLLYGAAAILLAVGGAAVDGFPPVVALGGPRRGAGRARAARDGHRPAVHRRGPPAGDEHVRGDGLGVVRRDGAGLCLLRALPGHDVPARGAAGGLPRAGARPTTCPWCFPVPSSRSSPSCGIISG